MIRNHQNSIGMEIIKASIVPATDRRGFWLLVLLQVKLRHGDAKRPDANTTNSIKFAPKHSTFWGPSVKYLPNPCCFPSCKLVKTAELRLKVM